jgi:FG-GAP repeat
MSGAGDVNHDGATDIIVGKYNFAGSMSLGGVRVLSGKTGGILYDYTGTNTAPIGFGVGGVGDVDLDGFADFMFLASDHIEVRSGKTGAVLLSPTEPDIGSTTSLHAAGDVNHDGYPDIIAGNWYTDEGVGAGGHATVFSGKDGSELCRIAGMTNGEYVGQAVGGGGDVDGDGVSDFLVSHYGTHVVEAYWGGPSGNYGRGWPGTNGSIPTLKLSAPPKLCTWVTITVGNSRGAATSGFLLYGLAKADLPTAFDGHMLVLPSRVIGLSIPATGLPIPFPIPCDPAYTGIPLFFQMIEQDPNASKGYSFTPGLKIVMGET